MAVIVRNRKTWRQPAANDNARDDGGPAARVALDVTSHGAEPWVRLSPFYPHGGIPVPFTPGLTGMSVEGIWQALMVFERVDVDASRLTRTTMRGMARASKVLGACVGHRAGLLPNAPLLASSAARWSIALPTFRWMLEHRAAAEVAALRELATRHASVILLDYDTNDDPDDLARPLSYAALIVRYLEDRWPTPKSTAA
jgi:hypothetical protein